METIKLNRYIKEIDKTLTQSTWRAADISHIMSLYRQVLELQKEKEKFKYLNLFANWTFHTELKQSNTGFKILEYITIALINADEDEKNNKHINDTIIQGLSIHKLLSDIIQFGIEYKIFSTGKFFNLSEWEKFATELIKLLIDKPIVFKENIKLGENKIYDSIVEKAERCNNEKAYGVKALYLHNNEKGCSFEIKTFKFNFWGNIFFINQQMVDELHNYHITGKQKK